MASHSGGWVGEGASAVVESVDRGWSVVEGSVDGRAAASVMGVSGESFAGSGGAGA